jgi:hypothetical protein
MSIGVYNAVPMVINNDGHEHRFTLRLSPSTESFRLESGTIRRSIFIGKRVFNKLFQLIRNEYGFTLGRIQYDDEQMLKGSASTEEHEQFRFAIHEGNTIEVMLEDEAAPQHKLVASIPLQYSNAVEKSAQLKALIPSVLAALIFTKELQAAV